MDLAIEQKTVEQPDAMLDNILKRIRELSLAFYNRESNITPKKVNRTEMLTKHKPTTVIFTQECLKKFARLIILYWIVVGRPLLMKQIWIFVQDDNDENVNTINTAESQQNEDAKKYKTISTLYIRILNSFLKHEPTIKGPFDRHFSKYLVHKVHPHLATILRNDYEKMSKHLTPVEHQRLIKLRNSSKIHKAV